MSNTYSLSVIYLNPILIPEHLKHIELVQLNGCLSIIWARCLHFEIT
jgi:hypothetical protein